MVGSPRLQGPYLPSLPLDGLLHGGGEFLHRAAVIHPRQCVRETVVDGLRDLRPPVHIDRKSTRLNSSHLVISYAVFCLKKKKHIKSYCRATAVGHRACWFESAHYP